MSSSAGPVLGLSMMFGDGGVPAFMEGADGQAGGPSPKGWVLEPPKSSGRGHLVPPTGDVGIGPGRCNLTAVRVALAASPPQGGR